MSRVDHSGQSWLSDLVVRGARAVVNIAAGIGAGISGAQLSGGGRAYGLGYRIGSGARAGAKKAAAAVKAAAPPPPAWTRNGPSGRSNTPLSVSLGTRGGSNFTVSSTRPVDCRNISYGPLTNGRGGVWVDLYDHYWGDTDKTSSLENLGYDLAGMIHPYGAAATVVPSLLNTRRDYSNGHIDRNRAIFNVAMDLVSTRYTSGASAFANAMDYADEKDWLDPINDFMSR